MTTNEGHLNMMKKPTQGAGPIAPKVSVAQVVERQKYYMVAGEIVFRSEDSDVPHAVRANAVVMSTDGQFAVPQIARAQQTLQHVFHTRMGEEAKIQVLDVVILSIMLLGSFTAEEFNKPISAAAPIAKDTPIPVTDIPIEEVIGHA
jgi:hypothetical protein